MRHSETIANLAAALVKAQKDLKPVAKDSQNPHFRNRYASLDAMVESVRPTLASHGLAVVQGASSPIVDTDGALCGFSVETMLLHSSGEWLLNSAIMPLSKVDAQGAGGAMTYGRRYGLSALLSLATDEDDDAQRVSRQRSGVGVGGASRSSVPDSIERGASTQSAVDPALLFVMPIGKNRGKPLQDISTADLRGAAEWIREKNFTKKHADLVMAIGKVLAIREFDLGGAAA